MSQVFSETRVLSERILNGLLEAHEGRRKPVVYNIYTVEGKAEACVYDGKVLTLGFSAGFVAEVEQFAIGVNHERRLWVHFTFMSEEVAREIAPFLTEEDVARLIASSNGESLRLYLQYCGEKKTIPPIAMEDPTLTDLFLDANWGLEFVLLFQYYRSVLHPHYYNSIKRVLERGNFKAEEEVRKRFLELALLREDQAVCELLDLHN